MTAGTIKLIRILLLMVIPHGDDYVSCKISIRGLMIINFHPVASVAQGRFPTDHLGSPCSKRLETFVVETNLFLKSYSGEKKRNYSEF